MARPATKRRRSKKRPSQQLTLEYRPWGGFRKGSGRKPVGRKAGVPHCKRPPLPSRYPVHVTCHLCNDLPNLRKRKLYQKLRRVFYAMHGRPGFRIVHFSVQRNHLHLIVEAKSKTALSRGMQSFKIRFANEVNSFLGRGRKGTVFADRYHSHILKSPTQTRNSIAYVILNGRRHGEDRGHPRPELWKDPCSSAPQFRGWRQAGLDPPQADPSGPAEPAGTWLLATGWRRARKGRIGITELPGPWPISLRPAALNRQR